MWDMSFNMEFGKVLYYSCLVSEVRARQIASKQAGVDIESWVIPWYGSSSSTSQVVRK
jgi:hypothetical protein